MNLLNVILNFVLSHVIEIIVGIISSIIFILFQSGIVNIFGWIKFNQSKYRYYIGDYYLYNYSTTGNNLIIETRLSIKQFFGKTIVNAEEPNFSFKGSVVSSVGLFL